MWCKECRQDVPGISSATAGHLSCARCGVALTGEATTDKAPPARLAESAASGVDLESFLPGSTAGIPSFEDWELEENFRQLQARIGQWKPVEAVAARPQEISHDQRQWRVHANHAAPARPHKRKQRNAARTSMWAWTVLSLGLMTFVCGVVLMVWSLAAARSELWNLGLPIAVGGQVGLLVGFVLQLERVWQNSRYAVRKLEQVDSQLNQLERAAQMTKVTHGSAAEAFYSHMATQADPHVLLADLKGQVDLLATSMARRSA